MTRSKLVVPMVALLLVLPAAASGAERAGDTHRVTRAQDGGDPNDQSLDPRISADGRWVAFTSDATNLVPADSNGVIDVFRADLATGAIRRVSVSSTGAQSNGSSVAPSISGDGRYVAFISDASNLAPADQNGAFDVFLHDAATGRTEMVSVSSAGVQANSDSRDPSISADGRFIAFESDGTNLVPGDENGWSDTFVRDLAAGTTELVSVATDGTQANLGAGNPSISGDGRFVAFGSISTNLTSPLKRWVGGDIYVHDRLTGGTELVSVGDDGTRTNDNALCPSISLDGSAVSFVSRSDGLVPGDTNGRFDVFVRDLDTHRTQRVNVDRHGRESFGEGTLCRTSLSADGRLVAFFAFQGEMVDGDQNIHQDVFIYDRVGGDIFRASATPDGGEADKSSTTPSLSADGARVVFLSQATNFADDQNDAADIYVRDIGPDVGVGGLRARASSGAVDVEGWASLRAVTLTAADDQRGDAVAVHGGADLAHAEIVYRPERDDLSISIRPDSMPAMRGVGVGFPFATQYAPGVVLSPASFGLAFRVDGHPYEARVLRTGATAPAPEVPGFALYDCAESCVLVEQLAGSYGSDGDRARMSIPLASIRASAGAEITDVRAFSTGAEGAGRAPLTLDDLALPPATVPEARVELAVSDGSAPAWGSQDLRAPLSGGRFAARVPGSPGVTVWARGCVGALCGVASTVAT